MAETIIALLEDETSALKAGNFSKVAETAERKARLLHQLLHVEIAGTSSEKIDTKIGALQNAIKTNLRTCKENMDSLKELIQLQVNTELDMENDGTYSIGSRQVSRT